MQGCNKKQKEKICFVFASASFFYYPQKLIEYQSESKSFDEQLKEDYLLKGNNLQETR